MELIEYDVPLIVVLMFASIGAITLVVLLWLILEQSTINKPHAQASRSEERGNSYRGFKKEHEVGRSARDTEE